MAERKFNITEVKAPKKLKALFIVVERIKVDFFLAGIESFGANFQTIIFAKGTASESTLRRIGSIDSSRALIVSLIPEELVKDVMIAIEDRYTKTKNGRAIAFTISLDSMIGLQVYEMLSNIKEDRI